VRAGGRAWPLALLVLTPVVPLLGVLPGGRWIWPVVAPLTLWAWFAPAVRRRAYGAAIAAGLGWAVLLSAGVVAWTEAAPKSAAGGIVRAEPYRVEMFEWIETGVGKENEPSRFVPEHLLHLGAFALLAWASGGYLGLVLGAGLTGYMSYFVGSFALSSGRLVTGALLAWVPWSVIRVVAFVILGSVLARRRLSGQGTVFARREWLWLAAAGMGLVADLLLKWWSAPAYGRFLGGLLVP
jgi:hypothetical protein